MLPLHHDPHFTFRFAADRLIPRFHLEGVEAGRGVSVFEIGSRLKGIPMSALKHGGSPYGFPRDVFEALVESAGGERPMSDAGTES